MAEDNISYTHKIFSGRVKTDVYGFVGEVGRIFYNETTGELRLSDGVTPYGKPIFGSGGGGGTNLVRYSETGTPVHLPQAMPNSIALGDGAVSRLHGSIVQSSGIFSNPGDAQVGSYIARGITTTGVFSELFLDGLSKRILVSPNTSIAFTITLIARRTDSSSNEGAVYEISGGIDRSTSLMSTRLIGVPTKTVFSEDNPAWDATVFADTTNGALQIMVKGEYGKTIRWVCNVNTVEVSI